MSGSGSSTCPNGHESKDPEWCDTCGAPMAGPRAAVAPAPPRSASTSAGTSGVTVTPVPCPHCGEINSADNLFCESCGYDFTTGQAPEPPAEAVAVVPDGPEEPAAAAGPDALPSTTSGPTSVATPDPVVTPDWVVVVEVDPLWHAIKGELADRPLPPSSTSTVPLFQHTSLIGRTSQSRGLRPEIALDTDTAVSRRHAQLLIEGDQLSVVDLSSTNGTYVLGQGQVPAADAVPLASGVPTALDDGDQILVGAWSRLTVRRT